MTNAGAIPSASSLTITSLATLQLIGVNVSRSQIAGAGRIDLANSQLTLDAGATMALGTIVSGTGDLVKAGNGSLTLNRVNTHTGIVDIRAGQLILGVNDAISDSAAVQLAGNTRLDLATFQERVASIDSQGQVSTASATGTGLIVQGNYRNQSSGSLVSGPAPILIGQQFIHSGSAELNGTLITTQQLVLTGGMLTSSTNTGSISTTLDLDLRAGTISVPISSGRGLIKSTPSMVQVNRVLTHEGATNVQDGTLDVTTANAIPAKSDISVGAAGTLLLTSAQTFSNMDNSGRLTLRNNSSARVEVRGNLSNAASGTIDFSSSELVVSGNISNRGSLNSSLSSLELNGPASTTQSIDLGTNVSWASLVHRSASVVQFNSPLTIVNTLEQAGTGSLDFNGQTHRVGSLFLNGGRLFSSTGTGGVTAAGNATIQLFAGILGIPISGIANVVKNGFATVEINVPQFYIGETNVIDGTLRLLTSATLPSQTVLSVAPQAKWILQIVLKRLAG